MEVSLSGRIGARYQQHRDQMVYVSSRDGAEVPMFVSAPGRAVSSTATTRPSSTATAASTSASMWAISVRFATLINRGYVVAQPSLRGGDEVRRALARRRHVWQQAECVGRSYASAEWLIAQGYTTSKRLVAFGVTAACWLALPPRRSARTCSTASSARCRCSIWCAITNSASLR